MKIDMLQALSLINLNSACIKCENIESDFLSVLDNEVINGNILEETNKVKVEKSLINEDEQRELREVDEKLIEFIGALLNKINSNNYENKVEVKDIYNQEIKVLLDNVERGKSEKYFEDNIQAYELKNNTQVKVVIKEDVQDIMNNSSSDIDNEVIEESVFKEKHAINNIDKTSNKEAIKCHLDLDNIINNVLEKNVDNTKEMVDNFLTDVENLFVNNESYISKEERSILNKNLELNELNNTTEKFIKFGLNEEEIKSIFEKVNLEVDFNQVNSKVNNLTLKIENQGSIDSLNVEELIKSNGITNKIKELGLNEEEINNIISKINQKIEVTKNSTSGIKKEIQIINIITEIMDKIKAIILNEKKFNNKTLEEFNTNNNLSLKLDKIQGSEDSSNTKDSLEMSDELEVLSSYRLSALKSKSINSQGINMVNKENSFMNEEIKNKYLDTLVQFVEVIDNSATTNKEIQIKKRGAETNINNTDNELNIVNNILITKNNNVTEVKEEIVHQQVIRSEYISEDFVQTIKYLKVNNKEEINVKMNPKNLGELNIKILKSNNEEKIVITLDNEETFNLVKENVYEIKNHLNSLDINIKTVVVEMKVGNQNDFSQNLNQQFNKNNKEEKKTRHTGSEQNNKEDSLEDDNININLLI